ncbi:hypothetical protein OAA72_06915 [Amylibacter sp.]|jgi:hypothetical protein|nr:hypothetical protein [Amylibacter sp.]
MIWIFRAILVGLAYFFPKFKYGYGFFLIILMHLISAFFIFAAWADSGTQPASVVRFEIYLAIGCSITGWVLGLAIMRQAERHQEALKEKLKPYSKKSERSSSSTKDTDKNPLP